MSLAQQRCVVHPDRAAAARCPGCRQHFCRECVVEHQGRLLCSSCLAGGREEVQRRRRPFVGSVLRGLAAVLGFLLLWALLFTAGDLLSRLPQRYHETAETMETLETIR